MKHIIRVTIVVVAIIGVVILPFLLNEWMAEKDLSRCERHKVDGMECIYCPSVGALTCNWDCSSENER